MSCHSIFFLRCSILPFFLITAVEYKFCSLWFPVFSPGIKHYVHIMISIDFILFNFLSFGQAVCKHMLARGS